MKYVVIDTETSDLMNFSQPADAPGQGRLAELAWIALDDELRELYHGQRYVRPEGWSMSPGATAVNGLTDEFLLGRGQPVTIPLTLWNHLLDEHPVVVGFHVKFDVKVLRGEQRRQGWPDRFDSTRTGDVRKAMWAVARIPRGRGWKWPTLAESCQAVGVDLAGAHGARPDAWATAELFRRLHKESLL